MPAIPRAIREAVSHPTLPIIEYPEDDESDPFAFSSLIYIVATLTVVLTFFLLYFVIYTYLVRSEPYYYTVPDPNDRHARTLRRVVPFREWIRRALSRPRSESDEFRQRDFDRVVASLEARGWRGHVHSDGTPDLSQLRIPAYEESPEESALRAERRRAWVERPDTKFWQEQAKLHPRERLFGPTLPDNFPATNGAATGGGYNTFANMERPAGAGPSAARDGFFRADTEIPDVDSSRFHHEREDSAIGSFGDDEEDYLTEDDEEERERQNQIFNYYQTYAAAFSYHPSPTEVMKNPFTARE